MSRIVPEWVRKRLTKGTTGKASGFKHGFRSGLEEGIADQLAAHSIPVVYETFRLPYMIPEKRHHYTPDFLLPNGILVEAKGIFDSTDRAKHLLVKTQFPGLDIRFVFTNLKTKIGPGSKTTVEDWCKRYGFKYAAKTIPPSWLHETGPEQDPRDLIKEGPFGFVSKLAAAQKR